MRVQLQTVRRSRAVPQLPGGHDLLEPECLQAEIEAREARARWLSRIAWGLL